MRKTSVYLPDDLKASLERLASEEGRSEAEIIRLAIRRVVERRQRPRPTLPLFPEGFGDPTFAERADELLQGFGEG
jgi:hypothetical protein